MKQKQRKKLSIPIFLTVYVLLIGVCIALDQITKIFIFERMLEGHRTVNVLGTFLQFSATYNSGAAFGIGKSDATNIIFFVITIIGVPLFAYLLWRSRKNSVCGQVGFAFIIGGTIGNAIDRGFVRTTSGKFFSGEVRDFISFSFFKPIFNLADSFLVIGVLLAIIAIVFLDEDSLVSIGKKDKERKMAAAEDETPHEMTVEPSDGKEEHNSEITDEKN